MHVESLSLEAAHCVTGAYDGTVRWRGHVQMSVDIFIYGAIEFIVAFRLSVVAFRVSVDRL